MKTLNFRLYKSTKKVTRPERTGPTNCASWSGGGTPNFSYSGVADDKFIYAIHLEKRRGKLVPRAELGLKGTGMAWRASYWVKTVTYLPKALLEHLPKGSKFTQYKHHWELYTPK